MRKIGTRCSFLFFSSLLAGAQIGTQKPLLDDHLASRLDSTGTSPTQVAIIGAGVGGVKAAFDLRESDVRGANLQITVFEKEVQVGGRIQTTYGTPEDALPGVIEEGASHFFTDDWCLLDSIEDVGLKGKDQGLPLAVEKWRKAKHRALERTEIVCDAESETWREGLRRRWRYGRSWSRFEALSQSVLSSWQSFAGPYRYPFSSILEQFDYIGMPQSAYISSSDAYLPESNISTILQNEFVQPCTRARLSQSLTDSGGLASLLAAGKRTTTSVEGGNSRLVERLIRLSYADVQLNSSVVAIDPGKSYGPSRRYQLTISRSTDNDMSEYDHAEFDIVIIAAPLQDARLDSQALAALDSAAQLPRLDFHITHFSTVSPIYSNLSTEPLDMNIFDGWTLTTSSLDKPNILNVHRSNVCFRRYHCLPVDECNECEEDDILCRIHSNRSLTDEDMIDMIGPTPQEGRGLDEYGTHFVRRKVWPRSRVQSGDSRLEIVDEIKIAPDLYYLNGAESVIDSMEMSCRMARNVAHLINVKRWGF